MSRGGLPGSEAAQHLCPINQFPRGPRSPRRARPFAATGRQRYLSRAQEGRARQRAGPSQNHIPSQTL
eukprot:26338-Pyramimonas_sp.AAC.1